MWSKINKHNESNKDKLQKKTNTLIFVHLVRINLSYFTGRKKNSPIHYKMIDTKRLQEIRSQTHKEITKIFYLIFKSLKSMMNPKWKQFFDHLSNEASLPKECVKCSPTEESHLKTLNPYPLNSLIWFFKILSLQGTQKMMNEGLYSAKHKKKKKKMHLDFSDLRRDLQLIHNIVVILIYNRVSVAKNRFWRIKPMFQHPNHTTIATNCAMIFYEPSSPNFNPIFNRYHKKKKVWNINYVLFFNGKYIYNKITVQDTPKRAGQKTLPKPPRNNPSRATPQQQEKENTSKRERHHHGCCMVVSRLDNNVQLFYDLVEWNIMWLLHMSITLWH